MKKPKKARQTHPICAQVKAYLDANGIPYKDAACQLLDYLPDGATHIQGTGEAIECTRRWEIQFYRWMAGTNTPRKARLIGMQNWLNDQKQTAEV